MTQLLSDGWKFLVCCLSPWPAMLFISWRQRKGSFNYTLQQTSSRGIGDFHTFLIFTIFCSKSRRSVADEVTVTMCRVVPVFFLLANVARLSQSMAVSARSFPGAIGPASLINANAIERISGSVSIRVRSTRERDLEEIASMLSSPTTSPPADKPIPLGWNWKNSVKVLKEKEALQSVLFHRFKALQEGDKAISKVCDDTSSVDRLRLLWDHCAFRSKLEKAAIMAKEPHCWKEHNFALCPVDLSPLQHVMITAEDARTGRAIGFVEVGMMERPSRDGSLRQYYVPTIANLVTSSDYRRMGVAGCLLKSASRYVKQTWSCNDIALYVDKANTRALALYQKSGFQLVCRVGDHNDKLYMSQPLAKASTLLSRG
jgi:ribosomal protein S18 acetylase RimI-like enzyme